MTAEHNHKSRDRVEWEIAQDRLMIEEGKRIYGEFVIQRQSDSTLARIVSYQGKAGAPDKSLDGMFTGIQETIRRIDQWLKDQGLPPVVDGPGY